MSDLSNAKKICFRASLARYSLGGAGAAVGGAAGAGVGAGAGAGVRAGYLADTQGAAAAGGATGAPACAWVMAGRFGQPASSSVRATIGSRVAAERT